MNTNYKNGVLIGVVASVTLVIGILIGSFFVNPSFGGVNFEKEIFKIGLWAGSPAEQIVNSDAQIIGELNLPTTATGTFAGPLIATGDIRIKSPVLTGASSTLDSAATTTITAAQACDNGVVNWNPTALTVGSTTLPTAASMYSDCLTTNGDEVTMLFRNLSSATTTIMVAGASSTLVYPEATGIDSTVNVSGWSWIRFMRLSATEMFVSIEEFIDAD